MNTLGDERLVCENSVTNLRGHSILRCCFGNQYRDTFPRGYSSGRTHVAFLIRVAIETWSTTVSQR